MKIKTGFFFLNMLLITAVACKTTETKPVSWKEQTAYCSKVKDPRIYGFNIYQTPGGIEYRDGVRLHPNQGAVLSMEAKKPLRPVVMLRGNLGLEYPVLMDFSSATSWIEFDLAQSLGAQPLGERDAQMVKRSGEEIVGCLSTVPSMRFDQLYIEHPLVCVRMATGSMGSLARGIEDPGIKGMVGWDLLKKFEQIQLDYTGKKVAFSTSGMAYVPDPSQLVAKIALVKYAGACTVRGLVGGKESLIFIDPAGDFEVATDDASAVSSVQLGSGLIFSSPSVVKSPGGTRIGALLLKNYRVIICPQAGWIYFEKLTAGKDR